MELTDCGFAAGVSVIVFVPVRFCATCAGAFTVVLLEMPLPAMLVTTLPTIKSSWVPEMKFEPGRAHLREDVPFETNLIRVHHADAGGRAADRLLVVAGRGQVVLARLRVAEPELARAHEGRMRERDRRCRPKS